MYSADPRLNASVQGTKMQVFARKEVTISGGVFNLPQLLKSSGIGPNSELERFGILVIVDLPAVGSKLQDNTESGLNTKAVENFTTLTLACAFSLASPDPYLPAWGAGTRPYAQGLADPIISKSHVIAFNERVIFMWVSAAPPRGFLPLSATVQGAG